MNKSAYGKAFGRALFIVAIAPLLSGIIGLLGDSHVITMIAVQQKYNKGIF